MAVFNDDLMCGLHSIEIEDETTVILRLNGCCSMSGATRIAQFVLPGCSEIITFNRSRPDVTYHRRGSKWTAEVPR